MEQENNDPFSTFTIQSHMDDSLQLSPNHHKTDKLKPRRKRHEIGVSTERLNASPCVYKLRIKYDGFFKQVKNSNRQKYCFGKLKTLNLDTVQITFGELHEELKTTRPLEEDQALSLCYLDNTTSLQSFIQLEDDISFQRMLIMYENEREVMIYMTIVDKEVSYHKETTNLDFGEEVAVHTEENLECYEEASDYCPSEESYHSLHSEDEECSLYGSDDDGVTGVGLVGELYSYDKEQPLIEIGARYPHAIAFRRGICHFAITKDFEFALEKSDPTRFTARCAKLNCGWRVHASVTEDGITFEVKTLQPKHSCSGVNKSGNKHATKGWIADRIVNDLRREGDISTKKLQKKLEKKFGILIPYQRVWKGKELALEEIYGKWEDSFEQVGSFKEEVLRRNPGSIVNFKTETVLNNTKKRKQTEQVDGTRHFQRFFVALRACTNGFLNGCRPYIGLDACHLKGKWKGCLAAATAVDGNNWMFPVAFAVMENESEESWEWFLGELYQAIGMPEGLVISSDMQKGLVKAVSQIYPLAEHRECMRHLYSNFKKHFTGDLFKLGLWAAAKTYSPNKFEKIFEEMEKICPAATQYLRNEHSKIWSRSKFGTTAKCDYITNNISETFNSWITEERHKPVLHLLDSIRKKIMVRFHERRRISRSWKCPLVPKVDEYINDISRNLKEYSVHRCTDSCAEVEKNGKRWDVNLVEKTCTCREWQIKGVPCVHGVTFITYIRDTKWEKYVDPYFTVARFKATYAEEIAAMPSSNEWMKCDLGYKMLPPVMKRPPGRPRKLRMKPSDEKKKKSNKCSRCGLSGHHKNTCKNAVPFQYDEDNQDMQAAEEMPTTKRTGKKNKTRAKKWACTTSFFNILFEE